MWMCEQPTVSLEERKCQLCVCACMRARVSSCMWGDVFPSREVLEAISNNVSVCVSNEMWNMPSLQVLKLSHQILPHCWVRYTVILRTIFENVKCFSIHCYILIKI